MRRSAGDNGEPASGSMHMSWLDLLGHPLRLHIVAHLSGRGSMTASELAECSGAGVRSLRRQLKALTALGLVLELAGESDSVRDGRPAACFLLNPRARESVAPLLATLQRPLEPWPRRMPLPSPQA
jgi:DNA-binding transcriptional ArsR family regulator